MNPPDRQTLVSRSEAHAALRARGIHVGIRYMETLAQRLPGGAPLLPGYKRRRLYNLPVILAALRDAASARSNNMTT
jgi:hypothetical protein